LAYSERKGKWRRQPGAAEFTAARAEQRKGGGHGKEGGSDGWGRPVSGTEKKRKGGGELGCCGRGMLGRWAGRAER
jgi:hypothetical protein